MYVYRNTGARSCNQCCSGKAMSVTYSESMFVALGIQHAMRMRMLSSVVSPAVQYCSTLSHKQRDFRKGIVNEYGFVCFDFLHSFCLKHFSFQEEFSQTLTNIHRFSCKAPVILVWL